MSVLDMVAKACGIDAKDILGIHELNAAGDAGGDLVIADRQDDLVMAHVTSVLFQQEPVQQKNLEYVVNCTAKTAGVTSTYPLAAVIAEMPIAIS